MQHWIIAPILLPALIAPLLVLLHPSVIWRRGAIVVVPLLLIALAVGPGSSEAITVYALGDWVPPFGIVLVGDRLSATMIGLTGVVALAAAIHSIATGWDLRGRFFHPLFLFQLFGINGAFLTGDVFNLFVFFEILLISSYGLIVHSGGKERLKAGVQYVVLNLAGSALFLFALGTIYAVTGTLNMADLGARAADLPLGDHALLRAAIIMLFCVFAIKAALVPFQFWLPTAYAVAPGPVAALFALLTKVGAYAILRMTWMVSEPAMATQGIVHWMLWPALITIGIGAAGMLAARKLGELAAYGTVFSMGTVLASLALARPDGIAATLYYMVHSTLAGALVFLVCDLISARRGERIVPGTSFAGEGRLSAIFFFSAIAVAGLPPLSGFIGKLLLLDASRGATSFWVVLLSASLIAILAQSRAGTTIFWAKDNDATLPPDATTARPEMAGALILAVGIIALTLASGPAINWAESVANQITDPAAYITAVLGRG